MRFSDWRGTPDGPYDRGVLIRTTIGLGAAAAGLTALTYGIAQAIENGSCGVDEYGNVLGAPCPDGFGPMIALMVLGTFVAIAGAALASSLVRFILPIIVAVLGGVVLGFLDLHATDTRPGLEIIAVVAAPMVLFTVPFVGKRRERGFLVQPQGHAATVTFGGPCLDRLFVTSARIGLSEKELAEQPLAGGLFEVATDAEGVPAAQFGR